MTFVPRYTDNDPRWRVAGGDNPGPEPFAEFVNPNKGTITSAAAGYGIRTVAVPIATGVSFAKGALVELNGSNEAQELTLTDKVCYGAALEAVSNGAVSGVVTDKVTVAVASYTDDNGRVTKNVFGVTDVNGVTPSSVHVGTKCALVYDAGVWSIDISDTAVEDVVVVGIDPIRLAYYIMFEANGGANGQGGGPSEPTLDPTITLSSTSEAFEAITTVTNPAARTVDITNTGDAGSVLDGLSASISYGAGSGWLSASLDTTTAPAVLTIDVDNTGLSVGTYTATITVASTATGVTNSPRTIAVEHVEIARPVIALSDTTLTFNGTAGGSSPAQQQVTITNSGGYRLLGLAANISYSSGSGWLSASLGSTSDPATLTLTADLTALSAGTYEATVSVSSTSVGVTNSPQDISVTFEVAAVSLTPTISLTPTSLSFSAQEGGSDPADKSFNITNSGTGTLDGLSVAIIYGTGSGWLAATLNSTTADTTVDVSPTTGALSAGTYDATVRVSSTATGVTNSPQDVSISFIVGSSGGGSGTRPAFLSGVERPRAWVDFTVIPTSFATDVSVGTGGDYASLAALKAAGPHDTTGDMRIRLINELHLISGTSFVMDDTLFSGDGYVVICSDDDTTLPARGTRADETLWPTGTTDCAVVRCAGVNNSRVFDLENGLRGNARLILQGFRIEANPATVVQGSLVKIGTTTSDDTQWPHTIIFDRMVVEGNGARPALETRRGVQLNVGHYIGAIDSTFNGFDNPNSDSNAWQIVSAKVGTMVNTRLGAGSECVIFGGTPMPTSGVSEDWGFYGCSCGPDANWPGVVLNIKNGGVPEIKYGTRIEFVHCYGANVDSSGQNGHAYHFKTANQGTANVNCYTSDVIAFECGIENCTAWYSPLGCNGGDGVGLERVLMQDILVWNCGSKWSAPVGASNPLAAAELLTYVPSIDIRGTWTPNDHIVRRISSWMGVSHLVLENVSSTGTCDGFEFTDVIASETPSPNFTLFRTGGAVGDTILNNFTNVVTGGSIFPRPRNSTSYGPGLGHISVANEAALLYVDPDNGDLRLQAGSPAAGIGVTDTDSGAKNPEIVKANIDAAKNGVYAWTGTPPDPMS